MSESPPRRLYLGNPELGSSDSIKAGATNKSEFLYISREDFQRQINNAAFHGANAMLKFMAKPKRGGRPPIYLHEKMELRRARALYPFMNRFYGEASVEVAIQLAQELVELQHQFDLSVEDHDKVKELAAVFPKMVELSTLVQSVSRGKTALGIAEDWGREKRDLD